MNGDAGTIDQSELEMLYQMMQKHDKNADGSINNDKNNHNYASMNNKMKNFVIIFKNEHKYLYWTIILSFILATLPFLYCLLTFFVMYKLSGWIFYIPFIIVLVISLLTSFVHKYIPKIINFITFILNTFIILIFQIFIGIVVFSSLNINNDSYMYDKAQYYEKVLKLFPAGKVAHFPKKIPIEATNVEMQAYINYWFGSDSLMLKFNINSEYMRKELKNTNININTTITLIQMNMFLAPCIIMLVMILMMLFFMLLMVNYGDLEKFLV